MPVLDKLIDGCSVSTSCNMKQLQFDYVYFSSCNSVSSGRQVPLSVIISPPLPHDQLRTEAPTALLSNLPQFVLPYVMLWNPLLQLLPTRVGTGIPVCTIGSCVGSLELKCWKVGQANSLQPRIVHTFEHTVLLVSAVFLCSFGHEVCSTDPRFLEQFSQAHVPFVLLHRTGFVKQFIQSTMSLIQQGLNFASVERFVSDRRQHFTMQIAYQIEEALKGQIPSDFQSHFLYNQISELISKPIPSNDVLCKCFVVEFLLNRESYSLHMSSILVKKYISIDHTFKVASNIGFVRSDGKWITLYNSVFIVTNENGQVVSWLFTRTTSLDEVASQLKAVKELRSLSWLPPYTILVDNCCSQRPKLKQIFGDSAVVKLDIFHAIQRISRKLPKRHPFIFECLNDLKMVFRSPTDIGKQRTKTTPTSSIILKQLNDFIRKWQPCNINGWRIITDLAMKEITGLMIHIKKGCLSDINPGMGTNKNEALHKRINTHFYNRSRIGLPFALSLLTILLFQHNCNINEKLTGRHTHSISSWMYQRHSAVTLSTPQYGINPKDIQCQQEISWISRTLSDVSLLNHALLQRVFQHVTISQEVLELISICDMFTIIESAINFCKMATAMQKQTALSPAYNYRLLPLMSSVASIFFHPRNMLTADLDRRLDDLLKAWGMRRHCIEGDGNCCFSAVAFGLLKNSMMITSDYQHFFSDIGLQIEGEDLQSLSAYLRMLVVQEWISNAQDYEGFVPGIDVQQEALKYVENGYFFGELANTIVLALANVLGLTLIIFTSIVQQPVVIVSPRHMKASIPIHIVFNQSGCGHYDAAVLLDTDLTKPENMPPHDKDPIQSRCSCGKNDKDNKTHCHPVTFKYTTNSQCSCYNKGRPCSGLCSCKRCNNSFGNRPVTLRETKRKRQRHQLQRDVSKSLCFALNEGELVPCGSRSMLEFFILESILKYILQERVQLLPVNIQKIYNALAEILNTTHTPLPVGTKTISDITTFLHEHDHNLKVFRALCLSYLDDSLQNLTTAHDVEGINLYSVLSYTIIILLVLSNHSLHLCTLQVYIEVPLLHLCCPSSCRGCAPFITSHRDSAS